MLRERMLSKWNEILTRYTQVELTDFLQFPVSEISSEIGDPGLQKLMVTPRSSDEQANISEINVGAKLGGDENFVAACGWKGVAIFNSTGNHEHLIVRGITSAVGAEYKKQIERYSHHSWTIAAERTPCLKQWLEEQVLPNMHLGFVRILALAPKGIVPPHRDILPDQDETKFTAYNLLNSIHISIHEPLGHVYFHDNRRIDFRPGVAMWVNNSKEHFAFNMGTTDRYHLIIHGIPKKPFRDYVMENIERMATHPSGHQR